MKDLFSDDVLIKPLAERVRPQTLDQYIGQDHILGHDKPLRKALEQDQLHSMVLWGPPGVGKTTIARLVAKTSESEFQAISAVLSGVKDIREAVERAKMAASRGVRTVLFVDEVHRFNKSQQDAFLPYVEDGTFVFIGATTENPSFELNNALLSRARVYRLRALDEEAIKQVILQALTLDETLAARQLSFDSEAMDALVAAADGDARRALGILETLADLVEEQRITLAHVGEVVAESARKFDKGGDLFYEQISALHKSVRGSSPDGALYWFCRMIDGGCDPLYVARRVLRMASEDIGNADPRALSLAMSAWQTMERLGSPEGELALAQAVVYLASAPKSNAVYNAYNQTMELVRNTPSYDVPMHLRNAPTQLMKDVGMGDGYRYAHDEPDAFAAGEAYLPEELASQTLYQPTPRGLEAKISDKLQHLKTLDAASPKRRYPNVSSNPTHQTDKNTD